MGRHVEKHRVKSVNKDNNVQTSPNTDQYHHSISQSRFYQVAVNRGLLLPAIYCSKAEKTGTNLGDAEAP